MPQTKRIVALDAFRGFTIAGMIMVNTPGSWKYIYPPLRHAAWHGCTPTDLVFPFFLFIVGVAMFFSFRKYEHTLNKSAVLKIIKRTVLIFLIGVLLNAFPFYKEGMSAGEFLSQLRILGVLQRIALAYGFAAILCLLFNKRNLIYVSVFILLAYWLILYAFGGENPYSLEGNVVRIVDIAIFGKAHIYGHYGIPFDPEGLLSTLPSLATVIFGYLTGNLIYTIKDREKLILRMFLLGLPAMFIAMIWDFYFPINKSLWTSSYVLYTAGLALVILAFAIWLIDVKGYKTWTKPLIVFGLNPLFIYSLSIVWIKLMVYVFRWETAEGETTALYHQIYQHVFLPIANNNVNASLFFALAHIIVYWAIGYILYRKKIIIKI